MSDYASEKYDDMPLFSGVSRDPAAPQLKTLVRDCHPDTSRIAAEQLVASGKHKADEGEALKLVMDFPGSTGPELDQHDPEKTERRFSKRLSRLADAELIERGRKRICKHKKSECTTWWPFGKVPEEYSLKDSHQ